MSEFTEIDQSIEVQDPTRYLIRHDTRDDETTLITWDGIGWGQEYGFDRWIQDRVRLNPSSIYTEVEVGIRAI